MHSQNFVHALIKCSGFDKFLSNRCLSTSRFTVMFSKKILNYYDILGVSKTADSKAIKEAFIKLSKKHHPDSSSEKDSHAKFLKINEAYSVLSGNSSRNEYDLSLRHNYNSEFTRHRSHYQPPNSGFGGGPEWEYVYYRNRNHFRQTPHYNGSDFGKYMALSFGFFLMLCGFWISLLRYKLSHRLQNRQYGTNDGNAKLLYDKNLEVSKK